MLREMRMTEFLEELASDSPAPGGGSVSAMVAATGAGLAEMVCSLTMGKKRYADVEDEIKALGEELRDVRMELTDLIDRDTDAFNMVMDAVRMPKDTEERKKARADAMQEAFKKAAEIPLETAVAALRALRASSRVRQIGNRNASSDAEIAVMLCHDGIKGAALNVRVNLSSIKDGDFVDKMERRLSDIEKEAEGLL